MKKEGKKKKKLANNDMLQYNYCKQLSVIIAIKIRINYVNRSVNLVLSSSNLSNPI